MHMQSMRRRFKNSLGVRIHMGRMHKDKAALPPPSTDTTTNTLNVSAVPTPEAASASTSAGTSAASNTRNRVAALDRMKTTMSHAFRSPPQPLRAARGQQSKLLLDNASPPVRIIQSTTTRLSVTRAARNRTTQPIGNNQLKCLCGKLVKGYKGYKLHIRACAVSKRLLIAPAPAQASSNM